MKEKEELTEDLNEELDPYSEDYYPGFDEKFGWVVDNPLTLEEFDKFMQDVINFEG